MPNGKGKKKETPASLDEQTLAIFLKEYDRLTELVTHSENSTQSIFNFYMTLLTMIVGGVILLVQISANKPESAALAELTIAGLLVFVALFGIVYLSAISGRYAHISRYAVGIDEIRRILFGRVEMALPATYQEFMGKPEKERKKDHWNRWDRWLFPIGTYQLFVAIANSLATAGAVWLGLIAAEVMQAEPVRSMLAVLVILIVTFLLMNVYSNYIYRMLVKHLNVQVDSMHDFDYVVGKL